MADQGRQGSAHPVSCVSCPLSSPHIDIVVCYIRIKPWVFVCIHVCTSDSFRIVWDRRAFESRTGLLMNRKRAFRTHRHQYTPLSWVEAPPHCVGRPCRLMDHHQLALSSPCVTVACMIRTHIHMHRLRLSATRPPRRTSSGMQCRTVRCDLPSRTSDFVSTACTVPLNHVPIVPFLSFVISTHLYA